MKKKAENMSLNGIMLYIACIEYSDSEMIRPARNAPSAMERPIDAVRYAIRRQVPITTNMNISRFRSRAA